MGSLPKKDVHAPKYVDDMSSQAGKSIAITGTTTGTGFHAAKALVSKAAHVLALNRASERSTTAAEQIRSECTGPEAGKLTEITCDLMSFESVRAAGAAVTKTLAGAGLDALVCNAGVSALPDKATGDGYDVQMQTNHLSHFLLTSTLLPALQAAPAARIVAHSSASRRGKPLDAKYFGRNSGDLGGDGSGARFERYHQSKLANVVFMEALKDKLAEKGIESISCVSCCPGASATSLADNSGHTVPGLFIIKSLMQSAADGALPLLEATVGADVASGDLLAPSNKNGGVAGMVGWMVGEGLVGLPEKKKLEAVCTSEECKKTLWEESEKAVGPFFG